MFEWIKKRSNMIANISLVITIGLVIYFTASIYFSRTAQPEVKPPAPTTEKVTIPGAKAKLEGVDFAANGRTLALVVQKSCGYCTASMPFYQTLIRHASQSGVPVIVVAPDTVEESEQYFTKNGITGGVNFHSAEMSSVNARGTPTIILFNDKGAEMKRWVGKLQSAAAEQAVLDQL